MFPLLIQLLLILLFPIGIYCWLLAMVNRRPHPVAVSGRWDFVGLLFAASGFLLIVGPTLLTGLYYQALHELPVRHQARPSVLLELASYRRSIWLAYYLVLLGGAIFLLWLRGRKTVIYNVSPAALDKALAQTLDRLGVGWARQGNRLFLGEIGKLVVRAEPALAGDLARLPSDAARADAELPRTLGLDAGPKAVLDLEPFAALHHVTLHWHGPPDLLRQEVEAELVRELAALPSEENPAATWLLGISSCLFGLMFLVVLLMILSVFLPRR